MGAVLVIERDDLLQMFEDFREQITKDIKSSLGSKRDERDDGYMTRKQTAKFLGIAESTLQAWRRDKRYDFPKPRLLTGGRILFKRAEIVEWAESRKAESDEVA